MPPETITCKICGQAVSKRASLSYRGGRACRIHDGVEAAPPRSPISNQPGTGRRTPTILELSVALGMGRAPTAAGRTLQATHSSVKITRAKPVRVLNPDQAGIMELLQNVQPGDEITLRFSEGEEGFAAVNYLLLLSRSGSFRVVDALGLFAVGSSHRWEYVNRTQKVVVQEGFGEHLEKGFAYRMGQPDRGRLEWIEFAPPLAS